VGDDAPLDTDARAAGRTRWKLILVGLTVMAATLFLVVSVLLLSHSEQQRRDGLAVRRYANAQSVLSNCMQIEVIKRSLREERQTSLKQLGHIVYYREHPDELAAAKKATLESIRRFSAINCYRLPTVKAAGLRPPASGSTVPPL
jgi:acid phosphatase class B